MKIKLVFEQLSKSKNIFILFAANILGFQRKAVLKLT